MHEMVSPVLINREITDERDISKLELEEIMKTRRFKALNGARRKYLGIVDKIAIYDNNGDQVDCCVIQIDDNGREYYCPSNSHDKFGLFTGKPKDAIECIKNGFGDGLQQSKLFGFTMEHVIRFIDREYGEEIRRKTIEGWKDVKFAYGVKFSFLNSFSGGRFVMKNETLMGYGDDIKNILSFDDENNINGLYNIKELIEENMQLKIENQILKDRLRQITNMCKID